MLIKDIHILVYHQLYRNICEQLSPPHNSNLIAKVAAAKNAPLSLNLTNEHFSSGGNGNFGINPGPKLPDMAKGNDGGRREEEEGLARPNTKE